MHHSWSPISFSWPPFIPCITHGFLPLTSSLFSTHTLAFSKQPPPVWCVSRPGLQFKDPRGSGVPGRGETLFLQVDSLLTQSPFRIKQFNYWNGRGSSKEEANTCVWSCSGRISQPIYVSVCLFRCECRVVTTLSGPPRDFVSALLDLNSHRLHEGGRGRLETDRRAGEWASQKERERSLEAVM